MLERVPNETPSITIAEYDYFHDDTRTTTVDPGSLRGRQVARRDPEHLQKIVQLRM